MQHLRQGNGREAPVKTNYIYSTPPEHYLSKNTKCEPSNVFHSTQVQVPLSNPRALILAKWFSIVDTEIQGRNVSAGITLAQFEGQNLNS